jgi:hypothetical protein
MQERRTENGKEAEFMSSLEGLGLKHGDEAKEEAWPDQANRATIKDAGHVMEQT